MQTTFLIKLGFWVEGLVAWCYKGHVDRKEVEDRISMTLQSLEMNRYIGNKTKSYQIQREFLLLFIFLGHLSDCTIEPNTSRLCFVCHQAVLSGRMPSSCTIRL